MPLNTMNETNRNVSRMAQSLAIRRDTLLVRIEGYGLRPGLEAPPLPQRAPACGPRAGRVGGGRDLA